MVMLSGLGMILGTVGIYCATFIRAPKTTTLVTTLVLLFIGQAVMMSFLFHSPSIFSSFPNRVFEYKMAVGTLGPILVAIHYQYGAIRRLAFNK